MKPQEMREITVSVTEEHLRIGQRSQRIRQSVGMNAGSRLPLGLRCPVEAALDAVSEREGWKKGWRVLAYPTDARNPDYWGEEFTKSPGSFPRPTFRVQLGEGFDHPVLRLPPEEGERIRRWWCPETREMEPHRFTLRVPTGFPG